MENNQQAFKAMTRIVLNNWHYIDHKVLGLNQGINFFTGHSGSGKSTVIDALQIVLYANTDGRGFFNKAAADDSDRSLIEYLRGMINIGENNQAEYKRNKNFSTTIVLELEQTVSHERECVGVAFDVETSTNDVSRLFFWHKGGLPEHFYRTGGQMELELSADAVQNGEDDQKGADASFSSADRGTEGSVRGTLRAMAIPELKNWMQRNFSREDWFYTSNNERFRRNLYDVYLGGLDMEKFPRLFKRAIPFRMNIRLEDFVKEYICMEQDIHIEDMQESVILYGRMRSRIEETRKEMEQLRAICDSHGRVRRAQKQADSLRYRCERLALEQLDEQLASLQARAEAGEEDLKQARAALEESSLKREELEADYDEITRKIAGSGYGELEAKWRDLKENLELLERSERKWGVLSESLLRWEEVESVSNQILWDLDKFRKGTVTGEELVRLKRGLKEIRDEAEKQHQEAAGEVRLLHREADQLQKDLNELMKGRKAYPRELEEARLQLQRGLYQRTGKNIPVRILADLVDVKDEKWRNALEGYLGWNKLSLMVEPRYVREAMELYEQLDGTKYHRVSLVDTEKVCQQQPGRKDGSLAEEVECREDYVRRYVDYLLGGVIKCADTAQLRGCRVGVTADCRVYQNFQLRRLNPDNYTRRAFIGEKSVRRRQKELQEQLDKLSGLRESYEESMREAAWLLTLEYLNDVPENYLELLADIREKRRKQEQLERLEEQMNKLGSDTVEKLKEEQRKLQERRRSLEESIDRQKIRIHDLEGRIRDDRDACLEKNEELLERRRQLAAAPAWEEEYDRWAASGKKAGYDTLLKRTGEEIARAEEQMETEKGRLVDLRSEYLRSHPGRDFSASAADNGDYQKLLDELSCDRIVEYEEKAARQAQMAVGHFREDFIYKIRSAIKEAYVRRDELNRIIRKLNFGKDRYQFKITRNKGLDGEYYDMFMDESLDIDPSFLSGSVEHQMDLFSMEHESRYGRQMNDLIRIFIPPEGASAAELEEARRNMEKYADYRTYLSFEMEQIVEGDQPLVIGLSRMIRKNSGGEGQNPLYVALLASFAQAYHINQPSRMSRRPTIRLVVLDEAFSKMDAEKVASCIELIRGLGFQAIISATNDKIQNYLENVDKTFVYANPNKKSISIQEFEKKDFERLETE